MPKPLIIAGGGLAGLALGIALRQRDIPVVVWEAGRYPRHRVCGEFISGRGQGVLGDLGLLPILFNHGARLAWTTAFFTTNSPANTSPTQSLPYPAICISRYVLDATLAGEFQRLGGILRQNQRWNHPGGEGVVWATGRRPCAVVKGWRWIGLKAHACGVKLTADLESHILSDGYIGLCHLERNQTNVCALFRTRTPVTNLVETWQERLKGPPGSALRAHMSDIQFIPRSFCSIAGIALTRYRADDSPRLRIGDALTMIPPITGNGMSMAFEAAAIATDPLEAYSKGTMSWTETRREIAHKCDRTFARRLRWSSVLHRAIFHPRIARCIIKTASATPALWRLLFALTR